MVEGLVMRDVRAEDVDTMVGIAVAAWAPVFACWRELMGEELFAAVNPNWEAEKARQVRDACTADWCTVCVAELGGRVVGFITWSANGQSGVGEIGNNAVAPEFQGQGIGPTMYGHVFDRMRELGMRFVKVCTGGDSAHAPARRAYEKSGFSICLPGVEYYRRL
jgi:ribosomal protein S18 acetylase RimI-like enzyme